jgi:leucyl aminopeptidase
VLAQNTSEEHTYVKITYQNGSAETVAADALITFVYARTSSDALTGGAAQLDAALDGELAKLIADSDFTGKTGSTLIVPTLGRTAARRVVLTGLGDEAKQSEETIRRGYGAAIAAARDAGSRTVAVALPNDDPNTLTQVAEAAGMATYRFEKYFGRDHAASTKDIDELIIAGGLSNETATQAISVGQTVASAVALARDLVNEPGSVIHPTAITEVARKIAGEQGFEIEVLGPDEMDAQGMGAIRAVGKGSAVPPQLIRLTYRPENAGRGSRVIGLVGKCITFDTGGYSIKPYEGMLDMKTDMSGGAAVLGVMTALKAIGCPHTVHGVICAAENMISGEAFRPGDILTASNGVTIEVLSTDAEGRLVLADGLVYTAKQGAQEMVDIATLTGAAVVALGENSTALFSNNDELAGKLEVAAEQAGEHVWRMPLTEFHEEKIKGEIGDIKNTGGRGGGAITAALFLQHFSEGLPWAHLDIAGSARAAKTAGYTPKGAAGVMVRTLLNYVAK